MRTEEPNLSRVEVVVDYKQLNEVERGFAHPERFARSATGISPQGRSRAGACVCGGICLSAGSCGGEKAARGKKHSLLAGCLASFGDGALRGGRNRGSNQPLCCARQPAGGASPR